MFNDRSNETKKWISKLEDKAEKLIQSEQYKEKKNLKK